MSATPTTFEVDAADASMVDVSVLRTIDLHDFATYEPSAPEFAIDDIVPRRLVTLLGAHGGAGKSILGLILAAHFAASRPWAGIANAGGRAMFVSLEDEPDLVRWRLCRVAAAYGLPPERIESGLVLVDGTSGDGALAVEVSEYGVRRLDATANLRALHVLAQGAGLIVVDNASDAFDADENSRRMVRTFVRQLSQLARETGAGVLLLAHIDKAAARNGGRGNSYSGSTAWNNSARSRLALIDRDGTLELVHEKCNYSKRHEPIPLRFDDNGILVPRDADTPSARAADAQDDRAVWAVIAAANEARVDVPPTRTGQTNAFSVLETFTAFPVELRARDGRRRFWSALERLQHRGCVTSEPYKDRSRHNRQRLIARVPA